MVQSGKDLSTGCPRQEKGSDYGQREALYHADRPKFRHCDVCTDKIDLERSVQICYNCFKFEFIRVLSRTTLSILRRFFADRS